MTDEQIIKALECCSILDCENCPNEKTCGEVDGTLKALDLIKRQKAEIERLKELVDTMGDYFPACIGCEGKTEFGERTDKCIYLIDTTNYCSQRGISNIMAIVNENRSLKAEIERLERANKDLAKEIYISTRR